MIKGDFGFHPLWTNLIKFVQNINVDLLKEKSGLNKKGAGG
jgi:hypothetical protein